MVPLFRELREYQRFTSWVLQAFLAGRATRIPDDEVDAETEVLRERRICRSNDAHVLALARTSGARLLFTNDRDLQRDFTNREILSGTRGRVYTTLVNAATSRTHRNLLNRTDLCTA